MSGEQTPASTREEVKLILIRLSGLRLTASCRGADMRILQFGELRQRGGGFVGDFALHIQCPWRIDAPDRVVTGRSDLWEPLDPGENLESWSYDESPNLQDALFDELMRREGAGLVVTGIDAGEHGTAAVHFANEYVLRLFPAGTRGEDWRLFEPGKNTPHVVIAGGKVEVPASRQD